MQLKEFLLTQFDREAAAAQKAVERVPEGKNSWKPHAKSMEFGYLAALVATMPGWAVFMVDRDELNLSDPSSDIFKTKPVESKAELLRHCKEAVAKGRAALERVTEEQLMKPWRFVMQGQPISSDPRYVVLANALMSHLAHHRGQLTVYLRLLDAKVPALYGPSADERF